MTGAISNISFNLPERRLVNQAFAVLAIDAGMDSLILDPLNKDLMGMIYARKPFWAGMNTAWNIWAYRRGLFGKRSKAYNNRIISKKRRKCVNQRENLLETIRGGTPDRFVNQYEAFGLFW